MAAGRAGRELAAPCLWDTWAGRGRERLRAGACASTFPGLARTWPSRGLARCAGEWLQVRGGDTRPRSALQELPSGPFAKVCLARALRPLAGATFCFLVCGVVAIQTVIVISTYLPCVLTLCLHRLWVDVRWALYSPYPS